MSASRPVTTDRTTRSIEEAEAALRLGNWREAARAYLDAAGAGNPSIPPPRDAEQGLSLKLRAADCYIRGGALGQGWALLRAELERCEIPVPTSSTKALLGTTWRRGRFMLRDTSLGGEPEPCSVDDELRMAVLDGAARSLSLVNTALADALRTRYLGEVARFGDASARCRALAGEIAMQTRIGAPFDKSVKKLIERCTELAAETDDPYDAAARQLALATYEFSHGRWRSCVEACVGAKSMLAHLSDRGLDVMHERARVAALHWFALAWLGELDELRGHLDQAILQAEGHKDSLMLLETLTGQPILVWLAADEVELVRDRAAELLASHRGVVGAAWPASGYRRQQYRDLMAEVHACLYRGDPTPAWAALVEQWRELETAFFLPMRTLGLEIRSARARVGVALIEHFDRDLERTQARLDAQSGLPTRSWDRARVLADARALVEALRRDTNCAAPALASLLGAGLSNLEGRREQAQIALDLAVREFNSVDMALLRECARYALGELIGGHEGGLLQDQAETWLRRHKVVRPRRLVASQAPGFGLDV